MNYEAVREDWLSLNKSSITNVINDKFEIDVDNNIDYLSNEFCDFYSAIDIVDDQGGYFAIVFKDNFYIPSRILSILKKNSYIDDDISMVTPIDYGITKISTKERFHFVVIVREYYFTETLSNYIDINGTLTYKKILKQLIIPFIKLIRFCKDKKIPCGNINPNNIIFQNGHLLLREIFIEPGNFYQPKEYIPLELLESIEYGRTPYSHKSDLYALGVTIYYAYTGINICEKIKNYDQDRMIHSTFKTLTSIKSIPMILRSILRYILEDNLEKRCDIESLIKLVEKQEIPTISSESNIINVDVVNFNKKNYRSLKHFAHGLFNNWDEAIKFVSNKKLLKQIQEYTNTDINILSRVNTKIDNLRYDNISQQEILLIKFLNLIDPYVSIRLRNFAISPNNILQVVFYAVTQNNKKWLRSIHCILKNNWWLDSYKKELLDYLCYNELLDISYDFRISTNIPEYMFIQNIHLFNPFLPCNGNLDGKYIVTIKECLEDLDTFLSEEKKEVIIDDNIVTFLRSRVTIYNKESSEFYYTNSIVPYTKMFDNLFVISEAQKIAKLEKIYNIVNFFGSKVFNHLIRYINNNKLKDMLKNQMISIIKENDLQGILSLINNNNLFNNDYKGFLEAQKQIDEIDKEIDNLYNYDKIYKGLILKWKRLIMLFSYMLCFFVFFIMIFV